MTTEKTPDPRICYQILMDIARTELKPGEVIVKNLPGAFADDSAPPTGLAEDATLYRTIVNRNRFAIIHRLDGIDHVVFDGFIALREDGWLEFSRRPPIVEKLLRMTSWQRWRLKTLLRMQLALGSAFEKLLTWLVPKTKYESVRSTPSYPGTVDSATGKRIDLRELCPIHVAGYLRKSGWEAVPPWEESPQPRTITRFRHPSSEYAEVDLVNNPDAPGFERAMRELLIRLAEFEARPEAAIAADMMR